MQQRMSPKNLCRQECMIIVTVAWILITQQVITCSHCYVYTYKRILAQLTSNTLCNSTTPVSIALAFSEPGTLQMMSGVADIDSKGPRGDTTVTHNTTWELSTVPQQTNTSLIWGCVHNTKVCKCTTCKIISNCTTC